MRATVPMARARACRPTPWRAVAASRRGQPSRPPPRVARSTTRSGIPLATRTRTERSTLRSRLDWDLFRLESRRIQTCARLGRARTTPATRRACLSALRPLAKAYRECSVLCSGYRLQAVMWIWGAAPLWGPCVYWAAGAGLRSLAAWRARVDLLSAVRAVRAVCCAGVLCASVPRWPVCAACPVTGAWVRPCAACLGVAPRRPCAPAPAAVRTHSVIHSPQGHICSAHTPQCARTQTATHTQFLAQEIARPPGHCGIPRSKNSNATHRAHSKCSKTQQSTTTRRAWRGTTARPPALAARPAGALACQPAPPPAVCE